MGNSYENSVEFTDQRTPAIDGSVQKSVDIRECLHTLAEKVKEHLSILKDGGSSGVTREFGKPALIDGPEVGPALSNRSQIVDQLEALEDLALKRVGDAKGAHGDARSVRATVSDSSTGAGRLSELPLSARAREVITGVFERVRDWLEDEKAVERIRVNPAVKAEHEKLERSAEERITDPKERQEFLANMAKFETRTAERENEYRRQFEAQGRTADEAAKLAADKVQTEIVETFKHTERLLESNARAPVADGDRVYLAEQVIQHAADPYSIAQGCHGTCTVAAIETRTFTNDPAAASRLIADVATTGKYTTQGSPPLTVTLDNESLKKHGESKELPPSIRDDGHRDYASQLFQVTAANIGLEKRNARMHPPGRLRYEQHEPVAGANPPDNGERLLDYSKNQPVEVKDKEGLVRSPDVNSAWQIAEISKEITPEAKGGELDGAVAIAEIGIALAPARCVGLAMALAGIGTGEALDASDPRAIDKAREALASKHDVSPKWRAETRDTLDRFARQSQGEKEHHQPRVESAEQLKDLVGKAQKEGRLPIIVLVLTDNNPLWTDSAGETAGGSGGKHVVTITDYNPITGEVMMQNQWDRASSHAIGIEDLYRAMRLPSANIAELQQDVDEDRRNREVDYYKEYDLLRLKHDNGDITDQEYKGKLKAVAIEAFTHQYVNGADFKDPVWHRSYGLFYRMLKGTDDQKFVDDVLASFRTAGEAIDKSRK